MNNNFVIKPEDITDRSKDFVGNMTNIKPSELTLSYFSNENVNRINIQLLKEVKAITLKKFGKKILIQPQKKYLVLTIMRYVYFENSHRHLILNLKETNDKVRKLNEIVLKLMTPTVMEGLISYVKYIHRFNSVPVLNKLPEQGFVKRGIINEYIKF